MIRSLILGPDAPSPTTDLLVEACRREGHAVSLIPTHDIVLAIEAGSVRAVRAGQALEAFDVVLGRVPTEWSEHGTLLLDYFHHAGVVTLPRPVPFARSRNKVASMVRLAQRGVPIPKTAAYAGAAGVADATALFGDEPIILKPLQGSKGDGVLLAESASGARALATYAASVGTPFLMQEFVSRSRGTDVRIVVIEGHAVAAVRRRARGDEYRSNVHLGGSAEWIPIEPAYAEIAERAANAMGLEIAGVDLLDDGDTPKVAEVNSSPGIADFQREAKVDLAGMVAALMTKMHHARNAATGEQRPTSGS